MTPMTGRITQFLTGWARETLSRNGQTLSTKRHVVAAASCVIFVIALWLTYAIYIRIRWYGEVNDGVLYVFAIIMIALLALCGIVYRKAEGAQGSEPKAPGLGGEEEQP